MKTIADLVTSKVIYIDGKKVGGALGIEIKADIDNPSLKTEVVVRFAIKRGSLHIEDMGTNGAQRISFSTTNEAFK